MYFPFISAAPSLSKCFISWCAGPVTCTWHRASLGVTCTWHRALSTLGVSLDRLFLLDSFQPLGPGCQHALPFFWCILRSKTDPRGQDFNPTEVQCTMRERPQEISEISTDSSFHVHLGSVPCVYQNQGQLILEETGIVESMRLRAKPCQRPCLPSPSGSPACWTSTVGTEISLDQLPESSSTYWNW